jgi:hypothetical protein
LHLLTNFKAEILKTVNNFKINLKLLFSIYGTCLKYNLVIQNESQNFNFNIFQFPVRRWSEWRECRSKEFALCGLDEVAGLDRNCEPLIREEVTCAEGQKFAHDYYNY